MKQIITHKRVGEYKYFSLCRFCGSNNIQMVVDLGLMPLAGGFIKNIKQKKQEKFYPLQLNFCRDCFLLQINSSVNPDKLFKNYFYFSSSIKTLISHFENIAKDLHKIFTPHPTPRSLERGSTPCSRSENPQRPDRKVVGAGFTKPNEKFVVEIGANDGQFIKALVKQGFKALGIDPAINVVKIANKNGIPIINSYFTEKLAEKIVNHYGKADAIYSFHSMAHIEDMYAVMRSVKKLLKKNGFLAMEVHYLGDLLKETQYDMIYHEHQFYYSLLSLENFFRQYDMEIFDIKRYKIRAGSIMYFVQNKGRSKKIDKSVRDLLKQEKMHQLDKVNTYVRFSKKIAKRKKQLIELLTKLKKENKKIIGYGASGRGTIIANYSELANYLDYVVDDAKAKHGCLLPGTHHKIFPSEKMIRENIDYAILFAWPFFNEVKSRNKNYKGKFIVPLPEVKIV